MTDVVERHPGPAGNILAASQLHVGSGCLSVDRFREIFSPLFFPSPFLFFFLKFVFVVVVPLRRYLTRDLNAISEISFLKWCLETQREITSAETMRGCLS